MRLFNRLVYAAQLKTDRYWDGCEEQSWKIMKKLRYRGGVYVWRIGLSEHKKEKTVTLPEWWREWAWRVSLSRTSQTTNFCRRRRAMWCGVHTIQPVGPTVGPTIGPTVGRTFMRSNCWFNRLNGRLLDSIVDPTVGSTIHPTVGRTPVIVTINVLLRPRLCINQKQTIKIVGDLNVGYKFHDEWRWLYYDFI